MRIAALALAAVVLAGCGRLETPEQQAARMQAETDSAHAAVAEGNARWARYVTAGQIDSLGLLFVADGVAMPPNVPGATGRDSIVARLRPFLIPGGTLTLTNQSFAAHGPIAVARGIFAYTAPAQGRTPAVDVRGKYLEHWHKTDAGWLLAETTWNTDAPTPPPPPPAR